MSGKTRVLIYITAPRKGFYFSLAKLLARDHEVQILARDPSVEKLAQSLVPELSHDVIVKTDFKPEIEPSRIVEEACLREKKYGETFSMIFSFDRALGQGYLFNADRHPHIRRSLWPNEGKLREILEEFLFYEHVMQAGQPDVVISDVRPITFDLVTRYMGKTYLKPITARISDRYLWAEDRFDGNQILDKRIKEYLNGNTGIADGNIEYREYERHKASFNALRFSYPQAVRESAKILTLETYKALRGFSKKNSYRFCGWIPPAFRKAGAYRFFCRNGVRPGDLVGKKFVYFPLHMEPETALLALSPEFNNSLEIISWVSKSLTAEYCLVIKENPWSYGVRSRDYYKHLLKIGNVALSHPDVESMHWIRASDFIVSITGTVGYEAVYAKRPVISYGKHQVINHLPTVRYVSNFMETRQALEDLKEQGRVDEPFELSRYALHHALHDVSFPLPGLGSLLKSNEFHMDIAGRALGRLFRDYPHLFHEKSRV